MEDYLRLVGFVAFIVFLLIWIFNWRYNNTPIENIKDIDDIIDENLKLEDLLKKEDLNEILGMSFDVLNPEDNCKIITIRKARFDKLNSQEAYIIEIYKYDKLYQPNKILFEHYYTKDILFMIDEIKRIANKYDICLFNQYKQKGN